MSTEAEIDDIETPQWWFRSLFRYIGEYEGAQVYPDLIQGWLDKHGPRCRSWLISFAQAEGHPIPPAHRDELNCLYAVSRVSQRLLKPFQPGRMEYSTSEPCLSWKDYVAFFTQLGMTVEVPLDYSPFLHEIVDIEEAGDPEQQPVLLASFWPCLMLGNMLFSRAGVRISVGSSVMNKNAAENSTIYWAYTRNNRACEDLSHGWGSNSQWRTAFRRDYRFKDDLYFNVDEPYHVEQERPPEPDVLPLAQRIELVKYHHFLTDESARYAQEDPFPYFYNLRSSITDPSAAHPLGITVPKGVAVPDYVNPKDDE